MSEQMFDTIDEALGEIAGRSFYESARVTKSASGYLVEDWHTGVEESVRWTYENGAELPTGTIDASRTHASYEFYETAAHIRYNLDNAVEAIEEGTSVGFTYVIADADCECDDYDAETGYCGDDGDHTVGWLLIATDETTA